MVSLRGSKFGSRVAMLCCNRSYATRPGPGTGMQIGRFSNFGDDRFQMTGQPGGRFNRGSQWHPNYPPFRWRNSNRDWESEGAFSLRPKTVIFPPIDLRRWFHGDECMVFLWILIQADGISWKTHQVPGSFILSPWLFLFGRHPLFLFPFPLSFFSCWQRFTWSRSSYYYHLKDV